MRTITQMLRDRFLYLLKNCICENHANNDEKTVIVIIKLLILSPILLIITTVGFKYFAMTQIGNEIVHAIEPALSACDESAEISICVMHAIPLFISVFAIIFSMFIIICAIALFIVAPIYYCCRILWEYLHKLNMQYDNEVKQ